MNYIQRPLGEFPDLLDITDAQQSQLDSQGSLKANKIDGTTDLVDVRDDLQEKVDTLNTDLTEAKTDLQGQVDTLNTDLYEAKTNLQVQVDTLDDGKANKIYEFAGEDGPNGPMLRSWDLVDVRDDLQGKLNTLNTGLSDGTTNLQAQIDVIDAALPDLTPRAELTSVVTEISAEQSDTEVKLIADSYDAVTRQTTTTDIPIPSATQAVHGAMTPAQVTALTNALSDIEGLKQTGGKFIGTFDTKADLDAYEIPERIKANDFVYVMDDETHDNAISKYVYDGAAFLFALVVEYDPTGIATITEAGLVLSGDGTAGSVDVDVNGLMTVHGWANATTNVDGLMSARDKKRLNRVGRQAQLVVDLTPGEATDTTAPIVVKGVNISSGSAVEGTVVLPVATETTAGITSADQASKIAEIPGIQEYKANKIYEFAGEDGPNGPMLRSWDLVDVRDDLQGKVDTLNTDLSATMADLDAATVKITGDQSIEGQKIFVTNIEIPATLVLGGGGACPITDGSDKTHPATKAEVFHTVDKLNTDLSATIADLDAANVKLTGNQVIFDEKTFATLPIVPNKDGAILDSTDPTHPATKAEVFTTVADVNNRLSATIADLDAANVKLTGNQVIGGNKEFTQEIIIPQSHNPIQDNSDDIHPPTRADVWYTVAIETTPIKNNLEALDAATVKITGDQSIEGEKTFATNVVVPEETAAIADATDATHPATKVEVFNTADVVKATIEAGLPDLTPRAELPSVVTGLSAWQNDAEVKLTASSYDAVTRQTSSSDIPIPPATQTAHGAMTPAQVTALTNALSDIEGLKQTGGKFIGTLATKAVLDAYIIPDRVKANDFIYIMNDETHDNAIAKYVYNGTEFLFALVVEYDPIGLATTTDAGLVLSGDGASGSVDVAVDGKMSVHGWESKADALDGMGFVKASGTNLSYDNSVYALDDSVVKLAGDQSIAGTKTITTHLVVPEDETAITNGTVRTQYATKAAVYSTEQLLDAKVAALDSVVVKTSGNQAVAGQKTFAANVEIPALAAIITDATDLVHPATRAEVYNTTKEVDDKYVVLNSTVVKTIGNQHIDGLKAFDYNVEIPAIATAIADATDLVHPATKAEVYNTAKAVDDRLASLDGAIVKTTGNQDIAGLKSFVSNVEIPAISTPIANATDTTHPATKAEVFNTSEAVKAQVSTLDSAVVKLAGDQSIAGEKTFNTHIAVPSADAVIADAADKTHYATKAEVFNIVSSRDANLAEYVKIASTGADGKMIKLVSWKTDSDGHVQLNVSSRDLSNPAAAAGNEDLALPVASSLKDGIMPAEAYTAVQTLIAQVAALQGSIIPRGTIQAHTNAVTSPLLTGTVVEAKGSPPTRGDAIKDLDNVTHVYNGSAWVMWGDGEIELATQSTAGIVLGKNADGYIFVNPDGSMQVVGWDSLSAINDSVAALNSVWSSAKTKTALDAKQPLLTDTNAVDLNLNGGVSSSFVDFHSDGNPVTDYNARILRQAGENGNLEITNAGTGKVLINGSEALRSASDAALFPTLNQNTTGTAAGLSTILPIGKGGTNASTPTEARANLGAASADEVVKLTGDQAISGIKQFYSLMTVPSDSAIIANATDTTHPATKAEVFNTSTAIGTAIGDTKQDTITRSTVLDLASINFYENGELKGTIAGGNSVDITSSSAVEVVAPVINLQADVITYSNSPAVPTKSAAIADATDTTHYATKAEVFNTVETLSANMIGDNATDTGATWSSEKISGELALKAEDDEVVKLAGDQSIAGEKTFDTNVVIPEEDSVIADDEDKTHPATKAEVYNTVNALGDPIDDDQTTDALTWSSEKIQTELTALETALATLQATVDSLTVLGQPPISIG
jgi:hypothetical protein